MKTRQYTRVVAILGSARSDGHARVLLDAILAGRTARRFDLGVLDIGDYAYRQAPQRDDFTGVAVAMAEADAILFVTPVYWYAMSGVLKRFFDRLTDLVTVEKPLGRRLAGRTLWVGACGSDPVLPEGFEVPFRETAAYFGMEFGDAFYLAMPEGLFLTPEHNAQAAAFGSAILRGTDRAMIPGQTQSRTGRASR
jgi:putative NADPH-quinone reductase